MIETQLKYFIISSSSNIPEIGNRLYIGGFPDKLTYPAVVMYGISRDQMHDVPVKTDRIQFSCYADTLSSATTIAEAIVSKLQRYTGRQSTDWNYIITNSIFSNMSYLYDSGVLKYVRIVDMTVRYLET